MQDTENRSMARRKRNAALILKRPEMEAVILILALVFVIGMVDSSFFAIRNVVDVLRATSYPFIITTPLTCLFISDGSGLSVSAVTNLGDIVCGFAMAKLELPILVIVLITPPVGVLRGLLKAGIVVEMTLPSLIITLGLQYVVNGFVLISTSSLPITGFSDSFKVLGQGEVSGVYWTVIMAAIEGVIAYAMLNRTKFGHQVCVVGGSQKTAELAGTDVGKTRTIINVLVSVLAVFCGVYMAGCFNSAQTVAMTGIEVIIMPSVVIGGTSMIGGSGTITGSFLGCLLLTVISNGLVPMHVSSFWQNLISDMILVISIIVDKYRRERSGSEMQRRERRFWNTSETVLEMHRMTKRFPGATALDDVNMDLREGKVLGICRENGAGKSALMKVLSGSYSSREYEGEIVVDGVPQIFEVVAMAQKAGIEVAYQGMNMMLDSGVAENLSVGNLPGKNGWVDCKTLYVDTQKLLDRVNLDLKPGEPVHPLNSEQTQILSLMRAVTKNPRILVLDEPTTALTGFEAEVMMKLLNELRNSGISCICISHRLEETYKPCGRVLILRDGHTIPYYDVRGAVGAIPIEEMVGRKVENLYPKPPHVDEPEEVFRAEHLLVPYPDIQGKRIVEDTSSNLKKGEILDIGSPVGAGRSGNPSAISGQYTEYVKKKVYIHGERMEIDGPEDVIAHDTGFVTEEQERDGIIWMLSIREDVSVANLDRASKGIFVGKKKETEEVGSPSDKLHIRTSDMDTKLVQLSGDNQQKVTLAKWLLNNPQILFMGKPTRGINAGTKADFYQLMSDLTGQGVSIMTVSSNMPELVSMNDRCIVIGSGHITGELAKNDISGIDVIRAAISE